MGLEPRPVPAGFEPYAWASTAEQVAARHGLEPSQVIRFDANVPPVPGVLQIPLEDSFAGLNEYPEGTYRQLREAAAAYAGCSPDRVVIGAGADDLIGLAARAFLAPARRAATVAQTYPLYAIASGIEGAPTVRVRLDAGELRGFDVVWVCNPNNPTGELVEPDELAALAHALPDAAVVVDEAYYEYAGRTVVPAIEEAPNLIAIRTLSKAFGLAALRVGYAIASAEVARILDSRRAPGPIATPAARIAAAALRGPAPNVDETIAERERMRTELAAAGFDCPPVHANFVVVRLDDAPAVTRQLEAQGLVVRGYRDSIRVTLRLPADNDLLVAALLQTSAG